MTSQHLPDPTITAALKQLRVASPHSHKGQNGKLLIIGGSQLFHAASRWSLDVAARLVDMVIYSSVSENNELIKEAKQNFWDGIVVPRSELESYISEVDCILIGPGMTRTREVSSTWSEALLSAARVGTVLPPAEFDWENDTYAVTNYLLAKYPQKKWVIDAGALQMLEPALLTPSMIITPHAKEATHVFPRLDVLSLQRGELQQSDAQLFAFSAQVGNGATVLLKGEVDWVFSATQCVAVRGGNAGMTKGGTGDVLAGLVAGLACVNDVFSAAVVASYVNKCAGEDLARTVGPFFTTTELAARVPEVLWQAVQAATVE